MKNRKNLFIYDNAVQIIKNEFFGDMNLLPIIIKCTLHDGIMRALQQSKMLDYMIFHGETCLQRIYGSDRLSEDLDFCVHKDISELTEFKHFCKHFETVLRDYLTKEYAIENSDIFFREPKNDMSIVKEGDVFTWKIGMRVSLGEQQQLIKIDLENREPITSVIKHFTKLHGDAFSHNNIFVKVETAEELLANKFISFFQRPKLQYRDFYDIGFLSGICHNAFNETILYQKIIRRFSVNSFIDKIQVRSNLFDNMDNFIMCLRNELIRFITIQKYTTCFTNDMIEYTKNMINEGVTLCYSMFDARSK